MAASSPSRHATSPRPAAAMPAAITRPAAISRAARPTRRRAAVSVGASDVVSRIGSGSGGPPAGGRTPAGYRVVRGRCGRYRAGGVGAACRRGWSALGAASRVVPEQSGPEPSPPERSRPAPPTERAPRASRRRRRHWHGRSRQHGDGRGRLIEGAPRAVQEPVLRHQHQHVLEERGALGEHRPGGQRLERDAAGVGRQRNLVEALVWRPSSDRSARTRRREAGDQDAGSRDHRPAGRPEGELLSPRPARRCRS